jgi:hypothetical protein
VQSPEAPKEVIDSFCVETLEGLLRAVTHRRTIQSLKNIDAALRHLVEVRSNNFSLSNVARTIASLKMNGPRAQSLKNKSGERFRTLIQAYALKYAATDRRREAVPADRLIASINDPQIRAEVEYLLAENSSLTIRLDMLKRQFKRLAPMEVDTLSSATSGVPSTTSGSNSLSAADQRSSVKRFLRNAHRMLECRWTDDGWLVTSGGHQISGVGFRQLLESISREPEGLGD